MRGGEGPAAKTPSSPYQDQRWIYSILRLHQCRQGDFIGGKNFPGREVSQITVKNKKKTKKDTDFAPFSPLCWRCCAEAPPLPSFLNFPSLPFLFFSFFFGRKRRSAEVKMGGKGRKEAAEFLRRLLLSPSCLRRVLYHFRFFSLRLLSFGTDFFKGMQQQTNSCKVCFLLVQ